MAKDYGAWLEDVRDALRSINMPMEDWQGLWPFDFPKEYRSGTNATDAAAKANRFWWHEQNKAIQQHCTHTADCWLPRGHQGACQPVAVGGAPKAADKAGKYKKGDHVKIEVEDKQFGIGEWMWMLVEYSDDEKRLVFGQLDNEPVVNPDMKLGQQLAVSYDKVREHRRFGDSKTVN